MLFSEYAILNKRLFLLDSDDVSQHVCQPDWVDEVEVVESFQMIIIVENHTVVMKKLSSYIEKDF